ncbi:hypothetical protein [Mucilaginibacter sp. 22184]|uniref:hypothetical protein n=1 Tax=Mucilaginibacter sp. 22184 TaxID=3453887 RepID=UPI003F83D927
MRTSVKILIAATVLVIVTLGIYDFQLKAEYLRGDFKNPFRDYIATDFSDFDSIDLHSASAINLMVLRGPYKVTIEPTAMDFVKITKRGRTLVFDASYKDHYRNINSEYVVFVSCPDLKAFTTDTRYTAGDLKVTDSVSNDFNWKYSRITGFDADSLRLIALHAANVMLENNRINSVLLTAGAQPGAGAMITLGEGNRFKSAFLDIQHKSTLRILSPAGNHITYQIADSARLLVTGSISKQLFKSPQP